MIQNVADIVVGQIIGVNGQYGGRGVGCLLCKRTPNSIRSGIVIDSSRMYPISKGRIREPDLTGECSGPRNTACHIKFYKVARRVVVDRCQEKTISDFNDALRMVSLKGKVDVRDVDPLVERFDVHQ